MKLERSGKIIEIITNNDVETQEELKDLLNKEGYNVTQATVSRDIRQLKLVKKYINGKSKYILPENDTPNLNDKYIRILKDGYTSMEMAQNILVIKTVSGMAMAVAAALDAMSFKEIVGCIAGDDTIMCAVKSVDDTIVLMDKLNKIINS
ncbi:transcriptional regulator, ArgR family [Lachnospiraceae bacterium RM5]|nr:transcriptional regulator, ArgR family [Lachnospiraceae bacterium RM5]